MKACSPLTSNFAVKGCVVVASSKEYLDFILEQLSELNDITYKAIQGTESVTGKLFGGHGVNVGHISPITIMPYGANARIIISEDTATFEITENIVE